MTAGGGDYFAPKPVLSHVMPVPSVPRGGRRRVVEGGFSMTAGGGDCFAPEPVLSHVLPVPSVPRGDRRRVVEGGSQ
jgi:hypothetical protein